LCKIQLLMIKYRLPLFAISAIAVLGPVATNCVSIDQNIALPMRNQQCEQCVELVRWYDRRVIWCDQIANRLPELMRWSCALINCYRAMTDCYRAIVQDFAIFQHLALSEAFHKISQELESKHAELNQLIGPVRVVTGDNASLVANYSTVVPCAYCDPSVIKVLYGQIRKLELELNSLQSFSASMQSAP